MFFETVVRRQMTPNSKYQRKLSRILRCLGLVPKQSCQDATELLLARKTGAYRVLLESRLNMLSIYGISDVVMEHHEMPFSIARIFLNRNATLQGAAWSVLAYGPLTIFAVTAHTALNSCNTNCFESVLDGVVCELEYCRENLRPICS